MSKKDLRSQLQKAFTDSNISPEPPLAAAYRAAVMSVCGVDYVHVSEWDFPRFENRQKQLDGDGIDYPDFAASVVKTWWGWCQTLGMSVVSVPIFCGPKAYARYKRDMERHPHVRIDTIGDDVHWQRLEEEYRVATAIIGWYPTITPISVRERMEPLLQYTVEPAIVNEVMGLLNRMYHTSAEDYVELAKILSKRRNAECLVSFQ